MPRLNVPASRRPARRRPVHPLLAWPPTRRSLRILLSALALTLGAASSVYVWRVGLPAPAAQAAAGARHIALDLTALAGLRVQEIFVEGRGETPAAQVLAALAATRGAPLLAISPAAAKKELERLPWVREAAVERRLPDAIHVRLVERTPLALWQRQGRLALIDRDGVEIRTADPARFRRLPIVVGDDAPRHAAQLLALLATEPDLAPRVVAAVRVSGRRWNLHLDVGDSRTVELQLPEENAGAAWARLADLERASKVLDRNVAAIDMRLPDRLVVRPVRETGAPAAPSKPAKAGGRTT